MSKHIEGLRAAAKATRELPEGFDATSGYFGGGDEPCGFDSYKPYTDTCDCS